MEPYENVTIGNFLYALGLALGARSAGRAIPGCINLLQQTPLDERMGDVLLTYPGAMRLLEFKRSKNRSKKEARKFGVLRTILSLPEHAWLISVSRSVHWFIMTTELGEPFEARVKPYLDFEVLDPADQTKLALFVDQLVDEALAPTKKINEETRNEYLKCLTQWPGTDDAGDSAGGLLVMLDDKGKLCYLALNDIGDLQLTHRKLIEMQQTHENAYARGRNQQQTLDPDLAPERERELGRGRSPERGSSHSL